LNYFRNLNPKPLFVIISGDLVEDGNYNNGRNYDDFINLFYKTSSPPDMLYLDSDKKIPVYICPGNHDHRWIWGLSAYDLKFNYPGEGDNHCYSRVHENIRICSMDSGSDDALSWYCDLGLRPEGNGLSDANINWLNSVLDDNNNIIFFHHPVINCDDGCWGDGCIDNKEIEFLNLCDSKNVGLLLCGHTHENKVYECTDDSPPEGLDITTQFDYSDDYGHFYLTYGGDNYYRTLDVQTTSAIGSGYRKISFLNNEIKVYWSHYVYQTSSGILYSIERKNNVSEIAKIHIYDSKGNHLGENITGDIDKDG
jgi:3',5'-cyclic AMP phosphodiesterase CpdA